MAFVMMYIYQETINYHSDFTVGAENVWPIAWSVTLAHICSALVQVSLALYYLQCLLHDQ